MWIGTIVGRLVGAWLSYSFILPANLLNLKLADMTIGDLLRIFGCLVGIGIVGGFGLVVDLCVQARRDYK